MIIILPNNVDVDHRVDDRDDGGRRYFPTYFLSFHFFFLSFLDFSSSFFFFFFLFLNFRIFSQNKILN